MRRARCSTGSVPTSVVSIRGNVDAGSAGHAGSWTRSPRRAACAASAWSAARRPVDPETSPRTAREPWPARPARTTPRLGCSALPHRLPGRPGASGFLPPRGSCTSRRRLLRRRRRPPRIRALPLDGKGLAAAPTRPPTNRGLGRHRADSLLDAAARGPRRSRCPAVTLPAAAGRRDRSRPPARDQARVSLAMRAIGAEPLEVQTIEITRRSPAELDGRSRTWSAAYLGV